MGDSCAPSTNVGVMIMTVEKIYHSFPGPEIIKGKEKIKMGVKILSSIRDHGFLLSPEIHSYSERIDDDSFSDPRNNIQKRCCFTCIHPEKLRGHIEIFGKFSIEFPVNNFKKMGGNPVTYLAIINEKDYSDLEGIASMLMIRIGEITDLLTQLSDCHEKINNYNGDMNDFILMKKGGKKYPINCSFSSAQALLNELSANKQPFDILLNAIRGMCGLFVPADDIKNNKSLAYYREREWRIIANMSMYGKEIDTPLGKKQAKYICEINPNFFNRKMKFHTGTYKTIDQCKLLKEINGKHILEFASRVIVPKQTVNEVQQILNEFKNIEVISLEDFDDL